MWLICTLDHVTKTITVSIFFLDWLAKKYEHKVVENAAESMKKEWD